MRFKKAQKEVLIKWVAEGLRTDEINKRAELFDPPFQVTRQQVDYYRKSRKVDIEQIRNAGEHDALVSGLSVKAERVRVLQRLAGRMIEDLIPEDENARSYLWTDQVKGIGSQENYERIDYLEFNKAEVEALRGVIDDIAKEVGARANKTELSGPDGQPLKFTDEEHDRALSTLAATLGEIVSHKGSKQNSKVDPAK